MQIFIKGLNPNCHYVGNFETKLIYVVEVAAGLSAYNTIQTQIKLNSIQKNGGFPLKYLKKIFVNC